MQVLLNQFFNNLAPIIKHLIPVESVKMTKTEADLFNAINRNHSDGRFNKVEFTFDDFIIRLEDVVECLRFVKFVRDKLTNKSSNDNDKVRFSSVREAR